MEAKNKDLASLDARAQTKLVFKIKDILVDEIPDDILDEIPDATENVLDEAKHTHRR